MNESKSRIRRYVNSVDVPLDGSGCWEWRKGTPPDLKKVWEECRGPLPEGYEVVRCCDNERCVNTYHMRRRAMA